MTYEEMVLKRRKDREDYIDNFSIQPRVINKNYDDKKSWFVETTIEKIYDSYIESKEANI